MKKGCFLAHDAEGKIRFYVEMHETNTAVPAVPAGCRLISLDFPIENKIAHGRENYVVSGLVVPKRSMGLSISKTLIKADATDEAVIRGIPRGALATIKGVISAGPETIDDGELIITSNKKGRIKILINCHPGYFTWEMAINAD